MMEQIEKALSRVEPHILSAAVINLENVAKNYHIVQENLAPNKEVAGVVKANAYGFGDVPVSRKLYNEGCRKFFVATIDEGISVRQIVPLDASIYVLSGVFSGTEETLKNYHLTPVLNCSEQADFWLNYADKIGEKLPAVIHIDTGMARNGFREDYDYTRIKNNLHLDFVMSHLACADEVGNPLNQLQLQRFIEETKKFGNVKKCMSATNGIFLGDDFQFDIVRPGKALYGFSIREDKIGTVIPVMDLFSRIVQVNHLQKGDTVGYGATFTAEHEMTTVTLGMGYADGFMRKFSGFGHGFLGGKKMPVVGRVSMDYMTLDASEVDPKFLKIGSWVALTNSSDYTLEKWALELNTIPHEVSCRIGERVKKVYIGEF